MASFTVKEAAAAAKKYVDRASIAGKDYETGVKNAGQKWQEGVQNAGESWKNGINNAVARDAYSKAVASTGPDKYVDRAVKLGATRYGPGVTAAGPEWQKNTQPYLDTIRNLDAPPKRERGNPNNMQRASIVAAALHAKRVGR